MDLLNSLNNKQQEAVQSLDGYYRVIAGAGSGKTKTLTHRFAWLTKEIGVPSSQILCVTFTNKAANEMKDRIRLLLDNELDLNLTFVCTFHSFCVKVLRKEIGVLGLASEFKILDVEDQKLMMKEMYRRYNISTRDYPIDDVLQKVGKLKVGVNWMNTVNALLGRDAIPTTDDMDDLTLKAIQFISFQKAMGGLDFNDLITFTTYLFKHYPSVRLRWSSRFDYVMVDETQDNSIFQWMLLDFLAEAHKNLYVVGDPDQAIYSFRGAVPNYLVSLDEKYNCKTIVLDQNYRSTPVILNAANNVIAHNRNRVKKNLFTTKENAGELIKWYHAYDSEDESAFVTNKVKELLVNGVDPKEISVLFRMSAQSRAIEQSFIKAGIAYQVYGGIRFFERQEIKDSLAYLSLLVNDDDLAFLRIVNKPARQLGDAFVSELRKIADCQRKQLYQALRDNLGRNKMLSKPSAKRFVDLIESFRQKVGSKEVYSLLQELLDESGYIAALYKKEETERIDNITELIGSISKYEEDNSEDGIVSINQYLQDISLFTNMDTEDKEDSVKLMTIHQSKGLEFNTVFLIGFNESILPSFRALIDINAYAAIEEERRLAYVAITRAKSQLYITDISQSYRGDISPSRFLGEIDAQYIEQVNTVPDYVIDEIHSLENSSKFSHDNIRLYAKGSKVRHPVYGIGEIVDINESERSFSIEFRTHPSPISISFEFTKLKLLDQYSDVVQAKPTVGELRYSQIYGLVRIISVDEIKETFLGVDNNGIQHECTWEFYS